MISKCCLTNARRERLRCVLFLSSVRKNGQQIVFSVYFVGANYVYTHFKHGKHDELLRIYFKSRVKKIKVSTLVAKSDL